MRIGADQSDYPPFSCRRQENNGFNQTGGLTDGQIKEHINK